MLFSTELLLAACVGAAMAGPHHMHRHVHAKKDLADVDWNALDWNNMDINWSSAWAAGQKTATSAVATPTASASATATASPIIAVEKPATTTPAASSTPAEAASSSSSSVVDDLVSDVTTLFSNIEGMANKLTAFGKATATSGSEVGAIGNIGYPEGSNIIKVSSVEGYDFTNTFINTQSVPITVVIWNKAATSSSGVVEANLGSCLALTTPALSFTLAPKAQQIVAFMANSQIGFAQATSAKTPAGAPDTTWGECNFTPGGSGFDVSSIVNSKGNTYDMSMSAAEVSCVSDMTQNDWIAENGNPETPVPVGNSDGSCYVPGNTMTLTTKLGGDV